MNPPSKVVITVHGIRTFGQWQDRLRTLIQQADPSIAVANYGYGYFSVVAFVIPIFRWLAVRAFRARLRKLIAAHPGASFGFVAHSFGTHLVAHALRGMKPSELPDIDVVILSGSVLKSAFDWGPLMRAGRSEAGGVRRVVNDCGLNDSVLILSQAAVLFTGMAGRVGFHGFTGSDLVNRFFPGGHSHYFEPPSTDRNAFMSRYWVPILASQAEPEAGAEIPVANTLRGIEYALFRVADPVKIALYGLLGFVLVNYTYLEPRARARIEQARGEYSAAATQLSSDRTVPDAFASVASILERGLLPAGGDYQRVLTLGRFALQRLAPAAEAIGRVPTGTVFSWNDFNYLKAGAPLRLALDTPIAYVHDDGLHRLIVVDRDSTITLMDVTDGSILKKEKPDENGDVVAPISILKLKQAKGQYLISFDTSDPNDDENDEWRYRIDLASNVMEAANSGLIPSDSCSDFQQLRVIDDDDDDDEPLSEAEQQELAQELARREAIASKCLEPIAATTVRPLAFPQVLREQDVWKSETAAAPAESSGPFCSPYPLAFPSRVRTDVQQLDYSGMRNVEGGVGPDSLDMTFKDLERSCFVEFEANGGQRFFITLAFGGQYNIHWLVCSLKSEFTVEACASVSTNWEATGIFLLSPDGRKLAISDRGNVSRSAWQWVDLATMTQFSPQAWPNTRTVAMAFAGGTLMVAGSARVAAGGVEIWAYRLDGTAALRARRIFSAPEGLTLDENQTYAALDRTVLSESDGKIVLATAFGQVVALDLLNDTPLPRWADTLLDRLMPSRTGSDAIVTPWTIPETGLEGTVTIATSPDRSVLAIAGGSSIRLIQAADGHFLTAVMDISGLPDCSGPIETVAVRDDLSVSATTANCLAARAAPPSIADTERLAANPSDYLGGGTPLHRVLPGERTKHPD